MVTENKEKVKWIPKDHGRREDTSVSAFDIENDDMPDEEELMKYFLEKIM